MISFISSWAKGIIVAVIIASIIEMILPNGTSKKYIKVVIGIYILFNIIAPVINKISDSSNSNLDVSKFIDLDTYSKQIESSSKASNNINNDNESNIKQLYVSNLKNDIKSKLEEMNYIAENIDITVDDDSQYTIKNVKLKVFIKNEELNSKENTVSNIEQVEKVNISISKEDKEVQNENKNQISDKQKNEIKEFLNKTYNIKIQNINIS